MTIREGNGDRRGVLVLSGPFQVDPSGRGATELRDAVADLLRRKILDVTLDVSDVPRLDAASLGEIVLAFTTVRRRGGQLQLYGPNARIEKILGVTRVDTIIPVRPSRESAPDATRDPASSAPPARPGAGGGRSASSRRGVNPARLRR